MARARRRGSAAARPRAPAAAAQQPTLVRSIYFYRIDAGTDDAGRPLTFDPRPALGVVDGLPFSTAGRYFEESDGDVLCCWVDSLDGPQRLRLARIRRAALPLIEQSGTLEPLSIAESAGLAEQIHVVLFTNDRIAASEFNFYGPRVTRLGTYLEEKGNAARVRFRHLLRRDVLQQLQKIGRLRLLELKVRESYTDAVREVNQSLAGTLRGALRLGEADTVDIILSRRDRRWLSSDLLQTVRRLARRSDLRDGADRFIVRGLNTETEKIDEVDVLRDALIAQKRIVRQDRSRALESDSAYHAIREAYSELRSEVLNAAEIG